MRPQRPTLRARQHIPLVTEGLAKTLGLPVAYAKRAVLGQQTKDLWLEAPVDDDWMAAYRLTVANGKPEVSELRLFPAEPDFLKCPAGEWSGVWRGVAAPAPRHGLSAKVISKVRVHLHLHELPAILEYFQKRGVKADTLDRFGLAVSPPRKTSGRGRKPLSREFLAGIADTYARAVAAKSKRPLHDVADHYDTDIAIVRGWVHKSRLEKLLIGGAWGRSGRGVVGGCGAYPAPDQENQETYVTPLEAAATKEEVRWRHVRKGPAAFFGPRVPNSIGSVTTAVENVGSRAPRARKKDAQDLLTSRLGDIQKGVVVTPKMGRKTLRDGLQAVIDDLKMNGRKSATDTRRRIDLHVLKHFAGERRMSTISAADIERYKAHRLAQHAAPATINRELAALRRAYRLALRGGELVTMPHVALLRENNVRVGFCRARPVCRCSQPSSRVSPSPAQVRVRHRLARVE